MLPALSFAAGEEKDLSFRSMEYPLTLQVSAGNPGKVCLETDYSEVPEKEYDTVLIQGLMPDGSMEIDADGKGPHFWSSTRRYVRDGFRRFSNGRFWARYRTAAPTRSRVRFSVTDNGLKGASTVLIYATELVISKDLREEAPPAGTETYVPDPSFFVPSTAPFSLVRRAGWQAAPPKEPYSPHSPVFFTIHHTQAHYPGTFKDSVIEMQFIQDYHQHAKGWNDIGYHFLIDPAGNIFEGRPIGVQGAHVLHHNTGNVGISIMGSYHPPANDAFTELSRDAFVSVGRYVKNAYSVQVSSFFAHRDLGDTDCPGDIIYAGKGLLASLIFDPQGPEPPLPSPVPPEIPEDPKSESLRQLIRTFSAW